MKRSLLSPAWALKAVVPLLLAGFAGCADPSVKGRGFLEGSNSVAVLSLVFVAAAIGIIGGLALLDRLVRSRRELVAAGEQPEPEDISETDPVVAGIRIGSAPPPRWLYGAYVVMPAFALMYLLNVADLAPKTVAPIVVPTADPSGATIQIVAKGIKFDLETIVLPATSPTYDLKFDNQDGVPHNVSIFDTEAMSETIFEGELITAEEVTYEIPVPPVGSYYFHCDVHPAMKGTVNVV